MLKLLFFVAGIYICFLTWGITQERVSTTLYDGKKFNYFVFLNAFQAFSATIVAFVYLLIEGKSLTIGTLAAGISEDFCLVLHRA